MRIHHIVVAGLLATAVPAAAQLQPVPPLAASGASSAAPAPGVDIVPDAIPVRLLVGRSTLIDAGVPIARVSLTSNDVADALVTSPSQLLVHGKIPGAISMYVWDRQGGVRRYEVAVQRDLDWLDAQVRELFPGEGVRVQSNGRHVVLSGRVSSQDLAEKIVSLASGYVERREDVLSLLQVQETGTQQVLLRVRFAEVSRSALTELGASFFTSPTGIGNNVGRVTTQQYAAPNFSDLAWSKESDSFGAPVTSASGEINFSDFLNLFLLNQRYDLGVVIRALQSRGLFQSLAEPNLVAESGKEASFLAGGEFPIPIAQGTGNNVAITVQFKEFGIRLTFTPTVVGTDRVHLRVRPEVSTLDFGNAVVLQGFRIPALITRRTETELELRDGQTFAIAGLMNNQMQSTMQKVPGLGDIPIIGYLFRSKAAQKEQTELVVMITPEILPQDSPGVTDTLPRMPEPFMDPLDPARTQPPPPPAFPPQSRGLEGEVPALTADQVESIIRAYAESGTLDVAQAPAPAPPPTARELRDLERREREEARRAAAEAERVRKVEEKARKDAEKAAERLRKAEAKRAEQLRKEEAKQAEADRKAQERAAREQAKRDAEEARREAQREAEREAARERAIAEAQASLAAVQQQYVADLARQQAGQ